MDRLREMLSGCRLVQAGFTARPGSMVTTFTVIGYRGDFERLRAQARRAGVSFDIEPERREL